MGVTGLERPPQSSGNTAILTTGGTESGTLGAGNDPNANQQAMSLDRDLAAIIEAWPMLPPAIRVEILAMVKAAASGKRGAP